MPTDRTLLSRLRVLEQDAAQDERAGLLNPDADLNGLDPQWVAEEVARCRVDPEYFIDNYCKVESDTGAGVVPFHLFDYQREVLRQWTEHRECVTLKARQLGITELAAALALWQVSFHPHTRVGVFSTDEAKAREFAKKCRVAWMHLPAWLQVPLDDPQKTTTLDLANGARILPQAATERASRGINVQLLILDEAAFMDYGQAIFEASAVTARSAGNRILVISTANGAGNHFHQLWLAAQAGAGMRPIFLPWHIRPGRDAAWYEQATKGYEPYKKHQEYPSRAEEAFILSGRGRFDTDALHAILEGCTEPVGTELGGGLTVWEMPVGGRSYVIGADPAEGLEKGDYSAAVVMDRNTGLDVAWLHGHFPPQEFAGYLADLGRWYNGALLGCERNNHGGTVLLELQNTHAYPNLYAHIDFDAVGNPTPRLGWPTTLRTKPLAIDALAQAIGERWPFRNAAFIGECRTYTVKENGSTGASGALHDDRVMAAAIAAMLRTFQPQQQVVTSLHDELAAVEPDDWHTMERQWHREVGEMHDDWGSMGGGLPTVESRY